MDIRTFRTDTSAWNCVNMAAQDTQAYIILLAKGTMDERAALVDSVRSMKKPLQIAIIEGGRKEFDIVFARWKHHAMIGHFTKALNRHLSTIPPPPRRGNGMPRGAHYAP